MVTVSRAVEVSEEFQSMLTVIGLIVCTAIIAYAIGIPWAISLILRLVTTIALLGILLYFNLPWWYVLIFSQNIARMWVLEYTTGKVRDGKLTDADASLRLKKFGMAADVAFYTGIIGMINHCVSKIL